MCGILGIATTIHQRPSVDHAVVARMRDRLTRRGPDDAGLVDRRNVVLAHRRLAVIDPSPAGRQPMVSPDGRLALVYNGELYNDADLRRDLRACGVILRSGSDAETLLMALAHWGEGAIPRLRGMYAFALHDAREHTVLLARDPLGIKPLYWWLGEPGGAAASGRRELVFASEIPAILEHPGVRARPDLAAVSAYLTTIRTTLGERTLYEGVRIVEPGRVLRFELAGREITRTDPTPEPSHARDEDGAGSPDVDEVRVSVEESVRQHLRSDVPICCLLSGGLDSSIIATIARRELGELHTYCSGAVGEVEESSSGTDTSDFGFARRMADRLGTRHVEAPVTRTMFAERWAAMVEALGVPLSTPNEVAINEVARAMRADGRVVTLSGEGADELFAGYEAPMLEAMRFEAARCEPRAPAPGGASPDRTRSAGSLALLDAPAAADAPAPDHGGRGRFQLESNAWIPPHLKARTLQPDLWRALEGDAELVEFYGRRFEMLAGTGRRAEPLQAHLRFHRSINLTGLLQRLDTATMLEGVEGRTPLADARVAAVADALPMARKFTVASAVATPGQGPCLTKIALREAFAAELPPEVLSRPKASFPLPFQAWVADSVPALRESAFLRTVFTPRAIEMVASRPTELWNLAWPMVNLALWGRRWG